MILNFNIDQTLYQLLSIHIHAKLYFQKRFTIPNINAHNHR